MNKQEYVYTYACHEDEAELCALELHTLLDAALQAGCAISRRRIAVDRSPFIKRRIELECEAETLEGLAGELGKLELGGRTFKVLSIPGDEPLTYVEHRSLERKAGAAIRGKADMRSPERQFGLIRLGGRWRFGPCEDNAALWLRHQSKPQNYSTALPTRVARALVNLAAGSEPQGKRLLDPCCGMGTVLVEAMSMGIDIEGFDINPLAVRGARTNLRHFGLPERVAIADMTKLAGRYDAALLDMPYNLCSVLPEQEQLALLVAARGLAQRAVIVATERLERQLTLAGWTITAQASVRKGSFTRYATVVE
jgi:16S rRNA G966 N2-methylase RsmD